MSTANVLLRTIPGERFTPYTLARKLNARVLLESASFHRGRERYSILLLQPAFTIQERQGAITLTRAGRRFRLNSSGRDILDVLRYFADQHTEESHPFPFPAGASATSPTSTRPSSIRCACSARPTRSTCPTPTSCSATCSWCSTTTPTR